MTKTVNAYENLSSNFSSTGSVGEVAELWSCRGCKKLMAHNSKTVTDIKMFHMTKIVDEKFSNESLPDNISVRGNIGEVTEVWSCRRSKILIPLQTNGS